MNTTKEKEPVSAFHRFCTVLGTVLCIVLVPILLINCTLLFKSTINREKVPDVGGFLPLIVLSDSMYPQIQAGDLIICHTEAPENVKAGDVISFFDPAGNGTAVVTHRVQEVTTDERGGLAWITKGDANNVQDEKPVPAENLVGVYWHRIAGAGRIAIFMQTTKGLIICVALPILLLLIYDRIRHGMYEREKKKDTEALMEELQRLRKEKEKQDRS